MEVFWVLAGLGTIALLLLLTILFVLVFTREPRGKREGGDKPAQSSKGAGLSIGWKSEKAVEYLRANMTGLVTIAGILLLFILFSLLFPAVAAAILSILGWPLFLTVAVILGLAVIFLQGGVKRFIIGGMAVILTIALLPAIWNSIPSWPTTNTAPVQTVYVEKCGNRVIHKDVLLTKAGLDINPNPHHCGVRWVVTKGAMKPVGSAFFGDQVPGSARGITFEELTTTLVATTTAETRVDYQLCPATHRSPGWC